LDGGAAPPRISARAWRILLGASLVVIMGIAVREQPLPLIDEVNDKIRHAAAFFALAMMADYSFPASRFGLAKVLGVLGYGVLIEVVQYFLPYRDASAFDVVADAAGIAAYAVSIPLHKHITLLARR